MKKFVSVFLLFAGIFCSSAAAYEDYGDSYWPKSYFITAGMGAVFSNGDLNEKAFHIRDSLDQKVSVHAPDISLMGNPEIGVGVNIRSFTLVFAYQYWRGSEKLTDLSHEGEQDYRLWRAGIEFTYNLMWPEDFQVGLGLGYSYTNFKTENTAYLDDEPEDTEMMAGSIAFIANVHYYFTEHLAVVPSIKVYESWFMRAYTDYTESYDLNPFIWQTFIAANIAVQFQF